MPEERPAIERVCPFLRRRNTSGPVLMPHEDNYCLLASSIHLPRAQQTRYCLGGRFEQCSRYQRQGARPIPSYVRGARPQHVRPAEPTLRLRTLPWRYPWVRPALKWTLVALLLVAFILLWRWRMANTPPYILERDAIPAAATIQPRHKTPATYLRPTKGPPEW